MSSSIVAGIHHLKLAAEYFDDFCRQQPNTSGARLFKLYRQKVEWIKNDLLTHPAMTHQVREGIRKEWESDVLGIMDINEKLHLLNPEQREALEYVIEQILKGETLKVEHIKEEQ
jgi:hypothetical protein